MEQDLALRGFSRATCESYVRYAKAFVSHFGRSAAELGTEHVRSRVLWLLTVKKLDASTVDVAIASLKLLFTTTLGRPEVMLGIRGVRKLGSGAVYVSQDRLEPADIERTSVLRDVPTAIVAAASRARAE